MATAQQVATFRIEDDRLLLDDIVTPACGEQASKSLRRAVFGIDEAVHAAWFTGVLVVPDGERQFRIHRTTQAYRDTLASMLAEGDWSEEDAARFLFLADTDYATDVALAFEPPMQ